MTGPHASDRDASTAGGARSPRWPGVIGTIGIVLSIIIVVDQIDDLITLTWTADEWQRIFAPGIAELIVSAAPPVGWRLLSGMAQVGLGVLLFFGSMALRRRTQWGVHLCKLWAWLAILWAFVAVGWGAWWVLRHAAAIPGSAITDWRGYAVFGLALGLASIVAFPVFLLVWFSQHGIRTQYRSWPRS